ncbi:hypothetical protein Tco_0396974 [Tanacetum coccineum]
MERRISKEEVKRAVWDCGVDKSPGPDGFSFSFYRHFWPVIEKDVFEAVDYFFMYGEIPNGCNSNFIALIPKIFDANMVKDFRPISLIGSLYKIIVKILANRLVGVLGDLVNELSFSLMARIRKVTKLLDYIRLKLGMVEHTRFSGTYNWYEGGVNKELFPTYVPLLELNKNATCSFRNECVKLDNSFRRKADVNMKICNLHYWLRISRMTTSRALRSRYV